ncbi:MAG: holA [Actinomycetia bacterium]|nr:holA [Actinomycetes bacterium]
MVQRALPSLHLVLGDDEFLASRAVSEVIAAARTIEPGLDVRQLEAPSLTPPELDELFSPSLFGERRVVVLRAGQDASKDLTAALLGYAANPADEVVLVVTHVGAAKGKALADGLRKAGAAVATCAKITKQRERTAFVRAEITRAGGHCTEEIAGLILDTVGNDLRELASVCSQLVADTPGTIDKDAVTRYHRGRAEVTGFTVADAAMAGDSAGALEALRWALSVGVDPVPIADALADGVRTVARVTGAGRGNAYQIAGSLGMPPWKVERAQRQARGWTPPALATAMRAAADVNGQVKGGADDRVYALERAVLAIAEARGGR